MSKKDTTQGYWNAWVGSIVLGSTMSVMGENNIVGMGLIGAGLIGAAIETVLKANPYKTLLENCNLHKDGMIPHYLGKRKTDFGHELRFSLPAGLSTDDFERNKLALEQYFGKRVTISYTPKSVHINVYEEELDPEYDYELIHTKGLCEFPVGYTYGKKLVTVDLEDVVHLLIAGETGSGKSTLLRSIITSLILDKDPQKLSLHLIDLKNGAEFNIFRRCDMVKTFSRTVEEAQRVLYDLLGEVERRYDLFYEHDAVDIKEYNMNRRSQKLDYKIVIVDEFADLQDEKGSISAVETLAAKARACGIHLIISTQRPDAKIINGRVKANIPCTIGLKTRNELNSRIIIDEGGLEQLRGKGHGLLRYSNITEFQAMYLSPYDARNLVIGKNIEKAPEKKPPRPNGEVKSFEFLRDLTGDKKDENNKER